MSVSERVLEFYRGQSRLSDPSLYQALFQGLPKAMPALCETVRGLLFHYEEGDMYGYRVPKDRIRDDAAREVSTMLGKIMTLDDRPLSEPRPFDKRLVGCCRDYALLLCSMLRSQGVAARVRFGWSLYFNPTFAHDHVVAEYWDTVQGWCLVDAQQDQKHVEMNKPVFDPHDIPKDWFLSSSRAWQLARGGVTDPKRFGYGRDAAGLWVIRDYLLHDFAALSKREMLVGDAWGSGLDLNAEASLALLDTVANAVERSDDLESLTALYQDERLRIPKAVDHYPLHDPSRSVRVELGDVS